MNFVADSIMGKLLQRLDRVINILAFDVQCRCLFNRSRGVRQYAQSLFCPLLYEMDFFRSLLLVGCVEGAGDGVADTGFGIAGIH